MPHSRSLFPALLAAILLSGAAPARAAHGDITFQSVYVPEGAAHITDVWGYSAAGHDYAVVGDWSAGVYVIDVTDPSLPVMAKDLTGLGFAGFDVKVWDHYIYVCNGSGNGTTSRAIDIADLQNPILSPRFQSAHNLSIDPAGYLIAELFGMRFYDITTDPMIPAEMWGDGSGDAHDASVVGDRLYDFRGIFGTHVWDITDRAAPVRLGTITDTDIKYHHSGYPTGDGNFLYICDEKSTGALDDITIWNIANPDSMVKVDGIGDLSATAHNLYIVGTLAFVSYYTAGFRVYDVSNPEAPVLADEYDTSLQTGEAYNGCFGVYPFTGSNLVYATDQVNGLFIFSVERTIEVPVAFTSTSARPAAGGVSIGWEVFADEPFGGFRVYRNSGDGELVISGALPLGAYARTFFDPGVTPGAHYQYTIAAIRNDGSETLSPPVGVDVPASADRLYPNHPNPFNPSTTIRFDLGAARPVRLDVFDLRGRHVRTLVDGAYPAGPASVEWDGTDRSGRPVVSGLYFYRLSAGHTTLTRRMVLLK